MTRNGPALCLLLSLTAAALPGRAAAQDAAAPEVVAGLPLEITASSALEKSGRRYGPEGLGDPEIALPWCEGEEGPGAGAWVEARLGGPARPAELRDLVIKIVPGYAKAERLFLAHGRPARATLTLVDRAEGTPVTPQDSYELAFLDSLRVLVFRIPVERTVDPSRLALRLAFDAVFPGGAFEMLCVSELRVFLDELPPDPAIQAEDETVDPLQPELAYLGAMLERAETGEGAALRGLIRLAGGAYAATAEGGQWLGEIYLDLLVARPWLFLGILEREDDGLRDKVLAALRDPVTDKHGPRQILSALRLAQGRGLGGERLADLVRLYTLRDLRARRSQAAAKPQESPSVPARPSPHP